MKTKEINGVTIIVSKYLINKLWLFNNRMAQISVYIGGAMKRRWETDEGNAHNERRHPSKMCKTNGGIGKVLLDKQ